MQTFVVIAVIAGVVMVGAAGFGVAWVLSGARFQKYWAWRGPRSNKMSAAEEDVLMRQPQRRTLLGGGPGIGSGNG